MSLPRGLTPEEQAAWAKLAQSVTPIEGRRAPVLPNANQSKASVPVEARALAPKQSKSVPGSGKPKTMRTPQRRNLGSELDSHWNRKLKNGDIDPDYTLDLHGHSLDSAYQRIMTGIDQARAMEARLVLVIAGRERPVDPADRANKRGAIRAKLLDWLAASSHADAVAAIRKAHIRHGGDGALYLVLKRRR